MSWFFFLSLDFWLEWNWNVFVRFPLSRLPIHGNVWPSSSICVCIDEMMLILIWPFDSYANMCRFFCFGGGSSNTQSNLIVPYYWESFSVPMCLTRTHWYSLSRSFSTSTGRGRCRMEKGGTYSCLLLTIPYPTCEGWCQATTLVMHITEPQTASGDFVCACMCFCCNAF